MKLRNLSGSQGLYGQGYCSGAVTWRSSSFSVPAFGFRPASPGFQIGWPMAAPPSTKSEDAALSLTVAVVTSSPGPLLLLDGHLTLLAASASFSADFDLDPGAAAGSNFFDLGKGEWRGPRHLVIQARRLDYLDLEHVRILVAVSDVTEARADARLKDETLVQNEILLKEVRHRVANSLQIIASVLLQNARKTQSEETRGHLKDAHSRVMSVAALERLLSVSASADAAEDVRMHDYLHRLCDSIGASMIADRSQISLNVSNGEQFVATRASGSLGLIVTELVINALKHAFPDGRRGQITVGYEARGPNWILSVRDDGVGMPSAPSLVRMGLGASIVEALARQLHAVVEVRTGEGGTTVCVEHTQLALVADEAIAIPIEDTTGRSAARGRGPA